MDTITIVRYASYALNGILLYLWINRKFVQRNFLAGIWQGTLVCSASETLENYVITGTLIITSHKGRDCKAYWHYDGKIQSDNISYGLDELINYQSDFFFFRNKVWNPKFVRLIHVDKRPGLSSKEKAPYNWQCEICNYWRLKEKMHVKIQGVDIVFDGYLQKV